VDSGRSNIKLQVDLQAPTRIGRTSLSCDFPCRALLGTRLRSEESLWKAVFLLKK